MADNEHGIDLVKVIKENFSAIQDGTYEWNEEEYESLKKIINKVLMDTNINFGRDREDAISELATFFFVDIVKNIDINREEGISSYIYVSLKGKALTYYNRQFKKNNSVVELDTPINNSKNEKSKKEKLQLIKSYDKSFEEKLDEEFYREYNQEVMDLVKKVPILNDIYIDKKKQREICEKYNLSRNAISYRKKWETEAIKIMLIQKGYTIDLVNPKNKASDVYKYVEKQIKENGLLKVLYNQDNEVSDIAEALELDIYSIHFAIRNLLKEKEQMLSDRGLEKAESYIDFTKYYFPKKLYNIEKQKKEYFEFIDKILDNDEKCSAYFRDKLSQPQIAQKFNTQAAIVGKHLKSMTKGIKKIYKEYVESDYDLSVVDTKKIKEYSTDRKKLDPYKKFTKYYFPELLVAEESKNDKYLKFIDKILDDNQAFSMYFRDNLKLKDIANKLNVTNDTISSLYYNKKKKMRQLYENYIKNNYDLSVVDLNEKIDKVKESESNKEYNLYEKFTKYYFPKLLDSEESKTESYYKFVDKILNDNEMYSLYFRDNFMLKEIADKFDATVANISSKFQRNKTKINYLYKKYLTNENDLSAVDLNARKKHIGSKKEHSAYSKFTKYYFSELLDTEEVEGENYKKFVDKILDDNEMYSLYFRDNLMLKEIADKLNFTSTSVSTKFQRNKTKIKDLYKEYIANGYDLSIVDLSIKKNLTHKNKENTGKIEVNEHKEDKKSKINLVKVIKENFDAIQNDTYEWSKEEVEAVYKLTNGLLNKIGIKFGSYKQDVCEEAVFHFFNNIVKKINVERESGISGYIGQGIKNSILMYYRGHKKYIDKVSLELDDEIEGKDSNTTSKIQLIRSEDKSYEEKVNDDFMSEYHRDLLDIAKDFETLKLYYIDEMKQSKIKDVYNVNQSLISRKLRIEKDTLKLLLMEKGYTVDLINSKAKVSDTYKYIEKLIAKNGLLDVIYNKNNSTADIAEGLDIDVKSVNDAIDYLLNKKVNLLTNRGIDNPEVYLKFTNYYFPELLSKIECIDEQYFKFVDTMINSDVIYSMYFKDDLKMADIASRLNMNSNTISKKFIKSKIEIRKSYKDYSKVSPNLNETSLNVKDVYPIKEDENNSYNKFTKYYFPELLDTEEIEGENYKKFVDKILDDNEMYSLYYRGSLNYKELAEKYDTTNVHISSMFHNNKAKINRLYTEYVASNYDLSIVDLRARKNYVRKENELDSYVKFTKYYFPELLDTEEIEGENYKKFVDKILDDNEVYSMCFRDNLNYKEIAKKYNITYIKVNSIFNNNKKKIERIYKEYVENNYDLSIVDLNARKKHIGSKKEHSAYSKFTKYYFSELLDTEEVEGENYKKFVDKILDEDEMYSMYFREDLKSKEIADKFNCTSTIINSKFYNNKRKISSIYNGYVANNYNLDFVSLDRKNIPKANNEKSYSYEKFTKHYFPELLNTKESEEENYHKFVDKILDDNEIYSMYFRNNLMIKEIADKFNMKENHISKIFYRNKAKIKQLYKDYIKSNCNLNEINANNIMEKEEDKGHNPYEKFTKYYFPKLLNTDESNDEKYHAFVDKILDEDEMYSMHFRDQILIKEIADKFNCTANKIGLIFYNNKLKISQLYDDYISNGYDLSLIEFNHNPYKKFTAYYFPELLNTPSSKDEKYLRFIDKILDSNKIWSMYFRDNLPQKQIANNLNKSQLNINSSLQYYKNKIRQLYNHYVVNNHDLNELDINKKIEKKHNTYEKFTKYYFEELLESKEIKEEKYLKFVDKILNDNKLCSLYFRDNLTLKEIADKFNTSENTISVKFSNSRAKMKQLYEDYVKSNYDLNIIDISKIKAQNSYKKFTKYYFPELLNTKVEKDEKYHKFIDKILNDNEMYSMYFRDNLMLQEIADKFNTNSLNINSKFQKGKIKIRKLYDEYVANNFDSTIVDINKKQTNEHNPYEKFTKYYFPELVEKEESKQKIYYKLVDKILSSDPILFKWYKENKTATQIASELWITRSMVNHMIQRSKQKIIDLYNQFLESNYDLTTLVINDDKYIEGLLQKGIENPKTYVKFTKYYFPELLDEIDEQDEKYFKMIDWIISKNIIFEKYFKEDKKQTEIAIELNTHRDNINKKLKYEEDNVRKIYDNFLICLKLGGDNAHCYVKFTEYYFPQLLDSIEKQHKVYFASIDYLMEKDKMLYKFFYEHKSFKEISDELGLKYEAVINRMNKSKPKIIKMYKDYLKDIKTI